jgi:UDP-N-acetyl-D-glucosamine dehydrogenase
MQANIVERESEAPERPILSRSLPGGALIDLPRRLAAREITVGVVGLGYVGLPLSCTIAEAGLAAVGFDIDETKLEALERGESYVRTVPGERIRAVYAKDGSKTNGHANGHGHANGNGKHRGEFRATADFSKLAECDAILMCVPTPLSEDREPDLSYVIRTAEAVAEVLRPGQIVVLESTSYPGTTEEIVLPILERRGRQVGIDFALAFSPEREDPGNESFTTKSIPKLVGGVTPLCGTFAADLYRLFIDEVEVVANARVAEAAKILENVFRSVNIALVNELKMLFDRMGIDVFQVIQAASTKPFGFMPFYPGPGLGGHCIPVDPFYLTWKARQYDFSTRFIELAGEINRSMPFYVANRVAAALSQCGKLLAGAKILILGVAYKKDINDLRESPALRLIEILASRGAEVSYNDPYVPSLRSRSLRGYDEFDLESVPLTPEALHSVDCVLIATDHSDYDWEMVVRNAPLVVDTRNATAAHRRVGDRIVRA